MHDDPTLDCQTCGCVLRHLSPAEAQRVAANPYNFIVYCPPCGRDNTKALLDAVAREVVDLDPPSSPPVTI